MNYFIVLILWLSFSFASSAQPLEITMWYSLSGDIGKEVRKLISDFNHSQSDYLIKAIYKGEYTETLTSFAAAFRAKQAPAIVQVFEVGTRMMLQPSGIIKPVEELMKEQKIALAKTEFLPAVSSFYTQKNKLMAMPFNISVPVLYYNADALAKIGYSAKNFPRTWQAMEKLAKKLREFGFPCAYTTAYPAWIQIESFSALHGLPLMDGQHVKATYNHKGLIKHLERLRRWQTLHYFEYGGRMNEATLLFTSEHCALFSQSSGSYKSLATITPFTLGVARLPQDRELSKKRYNNVIGGAALWAVAGQSEATYRGIALFFAYLARPETQQRWQDHTGYLPLGLEARYSVITNKHPQGILKLAQLDLSDKHNITMRFDLGPQNLIRAINDEALEAIFSGVKTPRLAMDEAVSQANYIVLRFQHNTEGIS